MKFAYLIPVAAAVIAANAAAQGQIWRCGNTYTNDPTVARNCKIVEGGNVTVVPGTRVMSGGASTSAPKEVKVAVAPQAVSAPPTIQRIDSSEQRTRDSEARAILEAELKKAEGRYADLLKEYNNGEPEKQGPEHKNHQKYVERVADLKTSIARTESDIAGLKRELGRSAK